ncbi:MAG: ferritin family protein [Deltaproteobacteria bacterium]|jgi:rubrerythrin|nr:ferritin family protein [Deltaproteobacteria bacterium]
MAGFITRADIITAAMEIERKGHQFYLKAQETAEDANAKEFFAFMAAEEIRHEKIFENMLQRMGDATVIEDRSDPEYLEYVCAILNAHMIFAPETDIKGKNPFMLALSFEKDSIVYFMSMLELVPKAEQKLIEKCIEEEKGHMRAIAKKRQEIEKDSAGYHSSIFVH